MRKFSVLLVLGTLASCAWTQPVARTVWETTMPGPTGSTNHRLLDMSWWQGPGSQMGLYSIGNYRSLGTRWESPINQDSKLGVGEAGSLLATMDGQWVTGRRVVSGPTNAGGYSGNVYFGGEIRPGEGGVGNIIVSCRSFNLLVNWNRILDVSAGSDDQLFEMAIDRRGNQENIYLAGRIHKDGVQRWFLTKYSNTGVFQWTRLGEPDSYATGLAIDDSGAPYVSYTINMPSGFRQNRIIKHQSNGDFGWRNGYNPTTTAGCVIDDIAIVDGGPVGVGFVEAGGASIRPLATAFNGAGVRRFGFTRTSPGRWERVRKTSDSRFYAVGYDDESPTKGVIASLIEPSTGSSVWTRKASSPSMIPSITYAQVDQWDNLYFGAAVGNLSTVGTGMFIGKYAPVGTVQWTSLDYTVNENKEPNAMLIHPTTGMLWLVGAHKFSSFQMMAKAGYAQRAVATSDLGMNDRYYDGATYTLVTGPASGSLTLNPNGSFSYTPPVGFTGTRNFTYKIVRAGVSDSNVATASINVLP